MKKESQLSPATTITGISLCCLLLLSSCIPPEVKTYGTQIGKMGVQSSRVLEDGRADIARNSSGTPNEEEKKHLEKLKVCYTGLRTYALRLLSDIQTPLQDGTKIGPATLEDWRKAAADLKSRQETYLATAAAGPHGGSLGAAEIAELTVDITAVIGALEKVFSAIANYSEAQKTKSIEFLDVQKGKWPAETAVGTATP